MTDETASAKPTSAKEEIAAIQKIVKILEGTDPDTRERIVGWLYERYRLTAAAPDPSGQ